MNSSPAQSAAKDASIGHIERDALAAGQSLIIGVDEAGRGPLAGPVQVAAVALDLHDLDAEWLTGLNDSKKLNEARRETLFALIQEHALAAKIVSYDHERIEELNILQATRAAMKEAIEDVAAQLADRTVDRVYVDGNQYVEIDLDQTAVVKGDARSLAIAAASILAKVSRDRLMVRYHGEWPAYGFDSHKGYGTKTHRDAIAEHGPCPIHRRSFGGVREYLEGAPVQGALSE